MHCLRLGSLFFLFFNLSCGEPALQSIEELREKGCAADALVSSLGTFVSFGCARPNAVNDSDRRVSVPVFANGQRLNEKLRETPLILGDFEYQYTTDVINEDNLPVLIEIDDGETNARYLLEGGFAEQIDFCEAAYERDEGFFECEELEP